MYKSRIRASSSAPAIVPLWSCADKTEINMRHRMIFQLQLPTAWNRIIADLKKQSDSHDELSELLSLNGCLPKTWYLEMAALQSFRRALMKKGRRRRGSYQLHGKTGNSRWQIKWFRHFVMEGLENMGVILGNTIMSVQLIWIELCGGLFSQHNFSPRVVLYTWLGMTASSPPSLLRSLCRWW